MTSAPHHRAYPSTYATDDIDFWLNGAVRATTHIRDENLRLAAENERLKKLLSEVIPELRMLREEQPALKGALRVLMLQSRTLPPPQHKERATFITLPNEILESIFSLAAAWPAHQFDSSVSSSGADNPWLRLLRTKKGFPLICRATFWPGVAALYGDVALRRMGQVSALADTLRTADTGPRLGSLVRSIRWHSCIVATPCADAIREEMVFILGQCTQLRSFSYHPHHQFPLRGQTPDSDECEGFFNPLSFLTTPSPLSDPLLVQYSAVYSLRSLDLSVDLQKVDTDNQVDVEPMLLGIHRILSAFKGLASLTLGPWSSNPPLPAVLMTMPNIFLPSLTDLQIFAPPREDVDKYLCSRWDAPQLTRLTILINTEWAGSPMRLLQRFGRHLRYLHLYPVRFPRSIWEPISTLASTLFAVCPLLEHLIVPRTILTVDSPALVRLDLWTDSHDLEGPQDTARADAYREWIIDAARSNAPSLRTVRFLFMVTPITPLGHRSAGMNPDWPWVCHPGLLAAEDEVLYHRFPQGRVAQTVAAIIPEVFWDKRAGEDSEFEGAAEDEGSEWGSEDGETGDDENREAETSSSDWTSDESEQDSDGNSHPDRHNAVIGG